jgi:hypothetical protein
MDNQALKNRLELNLMRFSPEKYLPKHVMTVQDIYVKREFVRELPCNDYTLNYLLDILIQAIEKKKRFRTLYCLKAIRWTIRNKPDDGALSDLVVEKLFFIYKNFINDHREDVQWCVSAFIMSQPLSEENIRWLISNYQDSIHLVNRLLRYPTKNQLIVNWAESIYQKNELRDRKSEVIALLIDEEVPSYVKENSDCIIWAIYHAKVSDGVKQQMLKEHFSIESIDAFIEVCNRLKYPSVLEFALAQL